MSNRKATVTRASKETTIEVTVNLDGLGQSQIDTGIGFDHMLTHLAKYSFIDLSVQAKGDLEVDCHHTIEDVGIVLGDCLLEAFGNKEGIVRYGSTILPMDESLVLCSIDLSGRAYLNFDCEFTCDRLGTRYRNDQRVLFSLKSTTQNELSYQNVRIRQ